MKWSILIILPFVLGLTPIYTIHDTSEKTDDEFKSVYKDAQPKNFRVVTDTPNLSDLQDGEVVILSSMTTSRGFVRMMFRANQEVYAISVSCVTIRR